MTTTAAMMPSNSTLKKNFKVPKISKIKVNAHEPTLKRSGTPVMNSGSS